MECVERVSFLSGGGKDGLVQGIVYVGRSANLVTMTDACQGCGKCSDHPHEEGGATLVERVVVAFFLSSCFHMFGQSWLL